MHKPCMTEVADNVRLPVKYWPHYTATIAETKTGQRYAGGLVDPQQWRKSLVNGLYPEVRPCNVRIGV